MKAANAVRTEVARVASTNSLAFPAGAPDTLRRRINVLGVIALIAYAAHTVLSLSLAAALPIRGHNLEGELVRGWLGLGDSGIVADWLSGQYWTRLRYAFIAYLAPLSLATLAFARLLVVLRRHRERISPETVTLLWRWAFVFGAVSLLALPVIVHDFWLSVVWGRMGASGLNPYYDNAAVAHLAGVPLAAMDQRMTYGPLWASVSSAVAFLSLGKSWLAALLFKFVLFGAWIVTMRALLTFASEWTPARQAFVVASAGWLPLSIHATIAEGHNDIVLVAGVTLWLVACARRAWWSTAMLCAATTVKYVSAPLFALDLVMSVRRWKDARRYAVAATLGLVVVMAAFGPWFRSGAFFEAASQMRDWHFWRPEDAIVFLLSTAGLPAGWVSQAVTAVLCFWSAVAFYRCLKDPSDRALVNCGLAFTATVLFASVGHVWPWFVVWLVPLFALSEGTRLARFCLGVAVAAPFVMMPWTFRIGGDQVRFGIAAVFLYGFALLWMRFAPFMPSESGEDLVAEGLGATRNDAIGAA